MLIYLAAHGRNEHAKGILWIWTTYIFRKNQVLSQTASHKIWI